MKILHISRFGIIAHETTCGYGGRAFEKPVCALQKMGCQARVIAPVPHVPFLARRLSGKWRRYAKIPLHEAVDDIIVFHPRYISFPNSLFLYFSGILMYYGMKRLIRKIHREFAFDLIHAHNVFPDGYAGLLLSRDYHKPLVVTVQATDLYITAKRSYACFKLLRKILASAGRVISPSPGLRSNLYAGFGINSEMICYGIDLEEAYSTASSKNSGDYGGRTILLSVSQLEPRKGIDFNLHALGRLAPWHDKLYYLIIGDGSERRKLEKLTRALGLSNIVKFLGNLPHKKTMEFMSICDIFSLPSWLETFGLVYLEAMAHGKPVIGCKGAGIDSIISEGKAGLLAEPKDVDSLAGAINFLLNNPIEAQAMGERARRLVSRDYSYGRNADQTLGLYKRLLNS